MIDESGIAARHAVVGSIASIPHDDPRAASAPYHEVPWVHYETGWRDREADHVDAIDRLCDLNGCVLLRADRVGEEWEPGYTESARSEAP